MLCADAWPLHTAAEKGNITTVRSLLKTSMANTPDDDAATPLHYAAKSGRTEVVRVLLAANANVRASTLKEKHTPLHLACVRKNNESVIRLLLDAGASVAAHNKEAMTALHVAARFGHTNALDILLASAHGDVVSAACSGDRTAFHLAAQFGHVQTMVHLGKHKDNEPAARTDSGRTALHCVCAANEWDATRHSAVIQYLIKLFHDMGQPLVLDAKDTDGHTALHLAVMNGRKEAVDKLIAARVPLLTVDSAGNTALHLACEEDNAAMVKLLIYADTAALRRLNCNGDAPIHIAAANGQSSLVELLATQSPDVPKPFGKLTLQIAADAGFSDAVKLRHWNQENVNVRTGAGDTPLIVAARAGHAAICKALIRLGADVNCSNAAGQTALHAAARSSGARTDIAMLLLKSGANLHAVAENGVKPLHFAAICSNVALVTQLLSHGAIPRETVLFWAVHGTGVASAPPRVHSRSSLESVSTSSGQANPQLDTVRLLLERRVAVIPAPWSAAGSEATCDVVLSPCAAQGPSTNDPCPCTRSAGPMSALQLAVDLGNDAVARLLFSTALLQNQHRLPLSELPHAMGRVFAAPGDASMKVNVTAAKEAAAEATTVAAAAEQYLETQDSKAAAVLRSFGDAEKRFHAALGRGCAADGDRSERCATNALQEARAALVTAAEAVEAVPEDAPPFDEPLFVAVREFRERERRLADESGRVTVRTALAIDDDGSCVAPSPAAVPAVSTACAVLPRGEGSSTDASPLVNAARCADALATLVCDAQADLVGLSKAIVTAGRSFTVQQWQDHLRSTKDRAVRARQEHVPWCGPAGLDEATRRLGRLKAASDSCELCRRYFATAESCSRPVGNESEAVLNVQYKTAKKALSDAEVALRNAQAAADESKVQFPGLCRPRPNDAAVVKDVGEACQAARVGNTVRVETIVSRNPAALNHPDGEGMTVLHHAAAGGHLKTVQMLYGQGANIKAENLDRKTPADMSNNTEIRTLLQRPLAVAAFPLAARRPLVDGGLSEYSCRLTERNARRHIQNDVESVVEQQSSLGCADDDDDGCANIGEH